MVYIRKHCCLGQPFYQINTPEKSILFDYPAVLCGTSHHNTGHGPASDGSTGTQVLFIVRIVDAVDCLFVSTSESLGCLFLSGSVRIFCTLPVYEQLLLLCEELLGRMDSQVNGPAGAQSTHTAVPPGCRLAVLDRECVRAFRRRVTLVSYQQSISLYSVTVRAVPAGTAVGSANYEVLFSSGQTLLYAAGYCSRARFSIGAEPIAAEYLILNSSTARHTVPPATVLSRGGLDCFTQMLSDFCYKKIVPGTGDGADTAHTLLIPLPLHGLFGEIFFHVLSVVDYSSVPIYIASSLFRRMAANIRTQGEWLNDRFAYDADPFPYDAYGSLRMVDGLRDVESRRGGGGSNRIVFCGMVEYMGSVDGDEQGGNLFGDQITVLINSDRAVGSIAGYGDEYDRIMRSVRGLEGVLWYDIVMEDGRDEILGRVDCTVISDDVFISTEARTDTLVIDGNTQAMTMAGDSNQDTSDSGLLPLTELVLSGRLVCSDAAAPPGRQTRRLFRARRNRIRRLIDRGEYALVDNQIVFYRARIRCTVDEQGRLSCARY